MIQDIREAYNATFTEEKYHEFLADINTVHPGAIDFRIAETPVFIPKDFKHKMLDACEAIIDIITDEEFIKHTERSIPTKEKVPGEPGNSQMIAFDFGICANPSGELEPQLIEMQGFPTLFGFQPLLSAYYRKHFHIPEDFSPYLGGLDNVSYTEKLRKIIVGDHSPEEVILLEINPHEQKTRIDFYCTQDMLGIKIINLTDLIREGKKLFYLSGNKKVAIKRIYNRVIFDELNKVMSGREDMVDITADLDVEWVPHPDWFYRISKFTLPFISHPYVPQTFFLDELKQVPENLDQFVMKPLFSFAGQGVIIDVKPSDIENIPDPQNWILQQKVSYADIIPTPDSPAKVEIRMMYLWNDGEKRPQPAINLSRLSKGKMIGVRYNQNKNWVGGSVCFFEPG